MQPCGLHDREQIAGQFEDLGQLETALVGFERLSLALLKGAGLLDPSRNGALGIVRSDSEDCLVRAQRVRKARHDELVGAVSRIEALGLALRALESVANLAQH